MTDPIFSSFPFDFTIDLPSPLPPFTDGNGLGYNMDFNFTAFLSNDVIGRTGQLQFQASIYTTTPLVPVYNSSINWFAGGPQSLPCDIHMSIDGGNLRCVADVTDHDWYFSGGFVAQNDCELRVWGDDVAPWNLETNYSFITNNNTSTTIPLHKVYPVGGGAGGGAGYWISDGIGHLIYEGSFTPSEILTTEIDPPPPLPDKGLPIVSLSSINLYPLPCFTPCTPHAIKQL